MASRESERIVDSHFAHQLRYLALENKLTDAITVLLNLSKIPTPCEEATSPSKRQPSADITSNSGEFAGEGLNVWR
jgi:hypothetical protein